MKIEPTRDNVVVKPAIPDEKTPGGIILPSSGRRERSRGVVVAVGPGQWRDGALCPMSVKPGDCVLFQSYDEQRIMIDNVEHVLIDNDTILGVIRD